MSAAHAEMRVVAIVVTWNRKDLLEQCLDALVAQTRRPDGILVIDNASDDGTADLDFTRWAGIEHIRLPTNIGGAGGFADGIRRACNDGADWLWVLDDDSLAEPEALEALLDAAAKEPQRPVVCASDVRWTNDQAHELNRVEPRYAEDAAAFNDAVRRGVYPIRSSTFVSSLIDARHAAAHGLPVADFFLWLDDVEYTARLLKEAHGIAVPASRVVHKTTSMGGTLDAPPQRYRLHVRNALWIIRSSNAYTGGEKLRRFLVLQYVTMIWLWRQRCHPRALWSLLTACCAAVCTKPAAAWWLPIEHHGPVLRSGYQQDEPA